MIELSTKAECIVCPTKIWEQSGRKYKKTAQYHEIDTELNNGSTMTVGVCPKHQILSPEDIPTLNEKLQQGWLEELTLGIGDRKWIKEKANKLTVIGTI